jgi:threonine synthase
MQVVCDKCHISTAFQPAHFRCVCGGSWEPEEKTVFNPDQIEKNISSVWRYRQVMGLEEINPLLSMGAGWTPLVDVPWQGQDTLFKLEYISPTGSFKDRGTEVEVNYLKTAGVMNVVEDSSGNAGASLAAYAARAGLHAAIYAPESASPAKLAQIQVYGAELRKIPGPRSEATRAALKAVEAGAVYASHAYNPVYLLGQQTFAWEIWEQLDHEIPEAVIIPVGQGGLLMGAWLGFRRLLKAGLIGRLPRLFAAQPESLAPVAAAFGKGDAEVAEITPQEKSLAEGLAIVKPVRGARILQALRESGGGGLMVTETEIRLAYHQLAEKGLFAEPSSAVAAAAVGQVRKKIGAESRTVTALTGSGLKSPVVS